MAIIDCLDWNAADEGLETTAFPASGEAGRLLAEFLQSGICNDDLTLGEILHALERVRAGELPDWKDELPYHVISAEPGTVRLQLRHAYPGDGPYSYPLEEALAVFRRWLVAIGRAPNPFDA